jgi:hypothetical protein
VTFSKPHPPCWEGLALTNCRLSTQANTEAPSSIQERSPTPPRSSGSLDVVVRYDRYRQIQQYRRSPARRARPARAVTSPRNGSTSVAVAWSQNSSVRTHRSATTGRRLACASASASRSSSDSYMIQGPSSPSIATSSASGNSS